MPQVETEERDHGHGHAASRSAAGRRKKPRHRSLALAPEYRQFAATGLEVRSASDGSDTIEITGKPIVYDKSYSVRDKLGEFQETMAPGVATAVLASRSLDCRFLFNHGGLPLARTASGTLKLSDTPTALGYVASLDARQSVSNDLAIAVERGDVTQMSCGFIVAEDEWSEDWSERTVLRFEDLLDISAVTYPASPSTSIEIAERMLTAVPIESRARIRRAFLVSRELREGRSLSKANLELISHALEDIAVEPAESRAAPTDADDLVTSALGKAHVALQGVMSAQTLDPDNGTDPVDAEVWKHLQKAQESLTNAAVAQSKDNAPLPAGEGDDGTEGETGEPAGATDGTGSRSAPATAAERRAAALSFGDQESLVYQALLARFEGGSVYCDVWVLDLGDDWVVFQSYTDNPGEGLWRLAYELDGEQVTFSGDPEAVAQQTTFVPVERSTPAPSTTTASSLALELELLTA